MTHASPEQPTALEAITLAQTIAFAPMLFQACWALRESGLLAQLDQAGSQGITLAQAAEACQLTPYAVGVLLDMGVSGQVVLQHEDHYRLGKVGHFLLHDAMTRVNMDFSQHVCYQGMGHLLEALRSGTPAGLKVFGEWPTIYPALSQLPAEAKTSWFAFDHFYSDRAFAAALPLIQALKPRHLYDVGGNTGKWALTCAQAEPALEVTILDLPAQIAVAQEQIRAAGLEAQIHCHAVDLLSATSLPGEADLWWMSQFLDCFSQPQIGQILTLVRQSMRPGARLAILELFPDRQSFPAASFSLNATSLYFTALANGNSRFYPAQVLLDALAQAGFVIEQQWEDVGGRGHTLLLVTPK